MSTELYTELEIPQVLNTKVVSVDIMKKLSQIKEKSILRYPRLDTVLMVEETIQKYDGEFKKKALWEHLPKKMMYQTFCVIMDYLEQSVKISIDSEGKIGWFDYPSNKKLLEKSKHLFWRKR